MATVMAAAIFFSCDSKMLTGIYTFILIERGFLIDLIELILSHLLF